MPSTVFLRQIDSFFEDLIKALPNRVWTAKLGIFLLNPSAMPESFMQFGTYTRARNLSTEEEVANIIYLLRDAATRRDNAVNKNPHTVLAFIKYFHDVLAKRFLKKVHNVKGLDYTLSSPENNAPWVALAKNLALLLKNARVAGIITTEEYERYTPRYQFVSSTGESTWQTNYYKFLMPTLLDDCNIEPLSHEPITSYDLSEFVYSEKIKTGLNGKVVREGSMMRLQNCLDAYQSGFGLLNVDTVPHQLITESQRFQILAKFPVDAQPDWLSFIVTPEHNEPSVSRETLLKLHEELSLLEATDQYTEDREKALVLFLSNFSEWRDWPGSSTEEDKLLNEQHKLANQIIFTPSKSRETIGQWVPTTFKALLHLLEGRNETTEKVEPIREAGEDGKEVKSKQYDYPDCSSSVIVNLRRLFLQYNMPSFAPQLPAFADVDVRLHPPGLRSRQVPASLPCVCKSTHDYDVYGQKTWDLEEAYRRHGLYGERNTDATLIRPGFKTPPSDEGMTSNESSPDSTPPTTSIFLRRYRGDVTLSDAPLPVLGTWNEQLFQSGTTSSLTQEKSYKRFKPRGDSLVDDTDSDTESTKEEDLNVGKWSYVPGFK